MERIAREAGIRPTALYRLFDADDQLLYVGITWDLKARWKQHQADKPWAPQVVKQTSEWYRSRRVALLAEARATASEHPRYSVQYVKYFSPDPSIPEEKPTTSLETLDPWDRTTRAADMVEAGAQLRAVMVAYKVALARAIEVHDEAIRQVAAKYGLNQKEIVDITGYSRETVRQAMDPEIRTAMRRAAEARFAARRKAGQSPTT